MRSAPQIASAARAVRRRFGEVTALAGVSLELRRGEITALAGANGAGKTTLLRILAGILAPDEGEVSVLGVDSPARGGPGARALRRRVAYLAQRPALDPEMTGREVLILLATLHGSGGEPRRRRVEEAIEAFGLESFVDRRVDGYSGGQKRRLHLAAGLVHDPELLLLDEPTAGLDQGGKDRLWRDLRRRASEGAGVALITHDAGAVEEHADTVAILDAGRVVEVGPPGDLEDDLRRLARPTRPGGRRTGGRGDGGRSSRSASRAGPSSSSPSGTRREGAGLANALDITWRVCLRAWTKTLRRPVTLTFSLAQPLIWMGFFGFLFQRYQLLDLEGVTYLDFLAPGVCAMTVLFGASQSGISWIRDLNTGFLPRLLNTPASPHAVLAGKIAADVLRLLVQAAAVLLLAVILGARLSPSPAAAGAGLLGLLLFAAAFSSLSCAIALRTRAQEAMATFVHLVNMPVLFTSTALVPARQMPPWLEGVARFNPLTLAVDAWRGALLFGQLPALAGLLVLALLTALLYAGAAREMGRIPRLY